MNKFCKGCNKQIHPLRIKALPNTLTCVDCSSVGMKKGITVLKGNVDKDDTWVDVIFIDSTINTTPYSNVKFDEKEE